MRSELTCIVSLNTHLICNVAMDTLWLNIIA